MKISARPIGVTSAAVLFALSVTGCGAIAEEAFEQAIENESGENVEIDFDSDDGSISIEGENGEEFSIDIDDDGESSVMSSTDEDGNTFEMVTGEGLPDAWPSEIPVPDGNIVSSTIVSEDGERFVTLMLEVGNAGEAHDSYVDALTSNGFTVGSTSSFESDGAATKFTEVTSSAWTGQITSSDDGAGNHQMIIGLGEVTE